MWIKGANHSHLLWHDIILSQLASISPYIIVLYNNMMCDKVLLANILQPNRIFQEILLCYMILSCNHFSQCIPALKIEASTPPINITLDYYTKHYATWTQRLDQSNPVMCQIPDQFRENIPIPSPPPLPCFPPPTSSHVLAYLIRQQVDKIKNSMMTHLIQMLKLITSNTK